MRKILKEHIMQYFYKVENSHLLSIVRRGFAMMLPVLVMGAAACAILNFPNESFRFLLTERYEAIWTVLQAIYQGAFGLFSLGLVVAMSISYAMEKNAEIDMRFFYIIIAAASFGTQVGMADDKTKTEILGATGCFLALTTALLSCFMFSKLHKIECISLRKYTAGMETIPANAVQSVLPAAITVGSFALIQYVLTAITGEETLHALFSKMAYEAFEGTGNNFISAFLYTLLVHVFWALGFHGSHMLETVAIDNFSAVGENIVFSKSFLDTYVMMGGCGTTICILIGIFLFSRQKRIRSLGKIAFPTAIFNANDILNFGIPLILNPMMVIPFVSVPIMAFLVSYGATVLGLVPYITHEITWTMPIIVSGYMATESMAGSVLQMVIVSLGIAIYVPFLKAYEKIYDFRMKEKVDTLVKNLQRCEQQGEMPDFIHRIDDAGMVTRMLLQELKTALKECKVYFLYQPQVDREGNYIGAEVLVRWKHPQYGFIYPPLIIYLATKGEILPDFERELINTSIKAIRQISEKSKKDFKISINITAHSLNWEIEEYIKAKLEEYQVSAEKLWLEITEHDVLINTEVVTRKIQQLKEAGHRLLIDDFGMGHTSLIYLQSDNFDVIKLDGSLVSDIIENKTNQKIVASVVELSKKLGIKIIAECVETKEQKKKLEELGCYYYQGYLYGKPMSLEQFIEEMGKQQ